ncbi:MAG: outer membrane protein assembly factor BamB family protein [Dehalococcoidales bacterium]
MKRKNIKLVSMIALLLLAIITIGVFGFSCVSGMAPIGWSGGVVANGSLYVGSMEGRLVAINLADQSILRAEPLKLQTQGGLLGCSSLLSCGGGSSRVPIYGTPVVSGNLVYIAGYNGRIYAYNTTNFASRWVFPRDGYLSPFVGGLVIDNGRLFIGSSDGFIYSLDAATGDLLSGYQTGDKIWGTPTVADNTLYIGSFDKKLYAFNTDDLTLKWAYTTEGSIIAKPLVNNGVVYIGSFDRNLYAINAADGTLKWKFMAKNWFWTQPVLMNDTLYAGSLDGNMYVLNAATGESVSPPFELKSPVASQPVSFDNFVIVATQNGIIYKIDATTQTVKQLAALTGNIDGPLMVYQGIIYFQTQDITLQRIDANTGAVMPPMALVIS